MNWDNLKTYKCPKCGKSLDVRVGGDIFFCEAGKLGHFSISIDKLNSLIERMNQNHYRKSH